MDVVTNLINGAGAQAFDAYGSWSSPMLGMSRQTYLLLLGVSLLFSLWMLLTGKAKHPLALISCLASVLFAALRIGEVLDPTTVDAGSTWVGEIAPMLLAFTGALASSWAREEAQQGAPKSRKVSAVPPAAGYERERRASGD